MQVSGHHPKVWTKCKTVVIRAIQSSMKSYLYKLGIFIEEYLSKLVVLLFAEVMYGK